MARRGVPGGAPLAAFAPEPEVPAPEGWPFPEGFPRTSGTGRMVGGAFFWSDFLYDDHGAFGVPNLGYAGHIAPSIGTYRYPQGQASGNGADIFRIAIGLDEGATFWRVDWNTLLDPRVPIAAFALDTDASPATGASSWPGVSALRSSGIDRLIVVSAAGAWLVEAPGGARETLGDLGGDVTVDPDARSFVVRLPRAVLEPAGTWRVRVASGLASASGDGFEPVPLERGGGPGRPPVYNVGFRSFEQEPIPNNLWAEQNQASALASGDVARFFADVAWAELAARRATSEPLPKGYTNRWYVSSIEVGHGIRDGLATISDFQPNLLGRVQPYAVYVPEDYDPERPAPLTWLLHSLGVNHNQFGGTNPRFIQQACEQRGSICATITGRGPDGFYQHEAELDFWEVWRTLASAYSLDPERTAIGGYSMGGYGTYRLGLTYPALFARAAVLAGPPDTAIRIGPEGPSLGAEPSSNTTPLVENARWLPYFIAHGALDELVPIGGVLGQVGEFDRLGYRHRFELYPAEDHVAYPLKDQFGSAARFFGDGRREVDPGRVTFRWFPNLDRPDLAIGATGAWWIGDVQAREVGSGISARIDAISHAKPSAAVTPVRSSNLLFNLEPSPAIAQELAWRLGGTSSRRPFLELSLANVATLSVNLARAGFFCGESGAVEVKTDGPAALTLRGPCPDAEVVSTVPEGFHRIGFL